MEQFRNIIYTTLPTKHNIQIIECIIVDGKLNGDIKKQGAYCRIYRGKI